MCIIFLPCLLPAAEVHVGKPGGGIWGPLERSVCSLPPARTGEVATWKKFSAPYSTVYSCYLDMLMILSVCLGRYSECSAVCSLCGGLLHLPLASGPRWRAVWTQGLVQHCGRPPGPSAHDGWWDTGVTLCHAAGRTNWWMSENINAMMEIRCQKLNKWMYCMWIRCVTKQTRIPSDVHSKYTHIETYCGCGCVQYRNEMIWLCLQGKNPVAKDGKACAASREQPLMSVDQEEYYIPSVDLLTAQVIICSHYTTVHSLLRLQQGFISRDAPIQAFLLIPKVVLDDTKYWSETRALFLQTYNL